MPRKINVINLDPLKEDVQPEVSNEIKVEFDDFTKIKNEVINNSDDDTNEVAEVVEVKKQPKKRAVKKQIPVVEEVEEVVEEVQPKKRATKKNNIVVEEVVVKPVEEVVKPVEEVKPKNIKTLELVNCDKCGKQMTKNTLRYHHDKNCPGLKVDKETLPVKKRTVKQTTNEQANDTVINIPKEVIENEVKKRIENTYKDRINERLRVKQEKMQKLATQIA